MSENLIEIFNTLKPLLLNYVPPLSAPVDLDSRYELFSYKDIEVNRRKKSEVFFSGIIIQRAYVGFYFMPIYVDPSLKSMLAPNLLSKLKGKSCFHFTYMDETLSSQIEEALKIGFKLYKERNWI